MQEGPKANGVSKFIIDTIYFHQENTDPILSQEK